MISCRERDHQQTPFFLGTVVEIPMWCLLGNESKFAGTQLQMLLLNLKLKCSFEDEKGLVVTMPMEWNSLLWCNSTLEQDGSLHTPSGRWLMLYASRLSNPDGHGQIAILFEATQPAEIAPLILQAYHLTKREGEVTQLILRGRSTREIAATLQISLNTVQDHLKAIFEKVNVGSRRELAGHIFAQQYQPHFTASAPLDVFGRLTSLDCPSSEDNIASS